MKYEDFDKSVHKFIAERDYRVTLETKTLTEEYELKKRKVFVAYHEIMCNKIGNNFKLMSLEDKLKFMDRYVGDRDALMNFMTPEELTALRIIE